MKPRFSTALKTPPPTGIVFDDIFLRHFKQVEHPESPIRLLAIEAELKEQGLFDRCTLVSPREATQYELQLVHEEGYIDSVRTACLENENPIQFHGAVMSRSTFGTASAAVGASIELADSVSKGELTNGFVVVRPPGHHAERDRYVGFCYFCTPAIVAKWLVQQKGFKRVFLLDLDYHGGNGSQHALENDETVYFCSMHGDPRFAFPHDSGYAHERGSGKGVGFTKNIPLPKDCSEAEFLAKFREEVVPEIDRFKPEFILVSLGFDILDDDPIGRFQLTPKTISLLTDELCSLARTHCDGRLVSMLEGGYNPTAMAVAAAEHLKSLISNATKEEL